MPSHPPVRPACAPARRRLAFPHDASSPRVHPHAIRAQVRPADDSPDYLIEFYYWLELPGLQLPAMPTSSIGGAYRQCGAFRQQHRAVGCEPPAAYCRLRTTLHECVLLVGCLAVDCLHWPCTALESHPHLALAVLPWAMLRDSPPSPSAQALSALRASLQDRWCAPCMPCPSCHLCAWPSVGAPDGF